MDKKATIVNVVATGELDTNVNLEQLYDAAKTTVVQYDPVHHQGLYLRFREEGPLITIYHTGKYIIRANSFNEIKSQREKLYQYLNDISVPNNVHEVRFNISNVVGKASLGREVALQPLSEDLQYGIAEYDPISQRLIYRISETDCTIIIFRTGQVMLMGASSDEAIHNTWDLLKDELQTLFRAES